MSGGILNYPYATVKSLTVLLTSDDRKARLYFTDVELSTTNKK